MSRHQPPRGRGLRSAAWDGMCSAAGGKAMTGCGCSPRRGGPARWNCSSWRGCGRACGAWTWAAGVAMWRWIWRRWPGPQAGSLESTLTRPSWSWPGRRHARGAWRMWSLRWPTSATGPALASTTSSTAGSCCSIWPGRSICCARCGTRSGRVASWRWRMPTLRGCSATRTTPGSASISGCMSRFWPVTAV